MEETAKVIDINETAAVESKALALPDKAKLIEVHDDESMGFADRTKQDIKAMIKEIDDTFKPMADKAFQAHRAITGKWKNIKAPLEDADKYLTGQVKAYIRKTEEEREAERKRLEEIARKQEEERRLQEAEALEKEAARLKAEGKVEEAESVAQEATQVIEEPIHVAPVVMQAGPKVDRRTYGKKYTAVLVDKMVLIRFVAKNPALQHLLDYNEGRGNRLAADQKEAMAVDGLKLNIS